MSVIVKGMEMPTSCRECIERKPDFWRYFGCCKKFLSPSSKKRLADCPLRPLPEKHGRLIDGDELADGCDDPHWCRWLSEIEDMPTIVEAEE